MNRLVQMNSATTATRSIARYEYARLWTLPVTSAFLFLASPGTAQEAALPPPPPPPPLLSSAPTPERVAALEANVAALIEQLEGANNTIKFALESAAAAREQIGVLNGQIRQLNDNQAGLQSKIGQLGDGYATHTHAISVWGTGCATPLGQPRGQKSCLYVIGDGRPTPRVTSTPTQLPPR